MTVMDKQGESPVVLTIPEITLQELRMRRSQRKPAPQRSDRPILNTVDLVKRAGEIDPKETALTFCEDMDCLQVEVEDKYDAFLLDPGMGPMTYITSDGRILRDARTWDGEGIQFETSLDAVFSSLVVGAEKTGIAGLLDMLPRRPCDAATCATCCGNRWWTFPSSQPTPDTGKRRSIVCPTCFGRGWVVNETECQSDKLQDATGDVGIPTQGEQRRWWRFW
jgi:hypothetical protein